MVDVDTPMEGIQASCLQPHHATRIYYPGPTKLTNPGIKYTLWPVHDSANRHKPQALINDATVAQHAGRDNEDELVFGYTSKALNTAGKLLEHVVCTIAGIPELLRLHYEMVGCNMLPGNTVLDIVTFHTDGDARSVWNGDAVQITRVTTVQTGDGNQLANQGTYAMPVDKFLMRNEQPDWFHNVKQATWYKQILHLLEMRSDRAARHVNYFLSTLDNREEFRPMRIAFDNIVWLPSRDMDYEPAIRAVTKIAKQVPDTDPLCMICRTELETGGDDYTLELPCRHLVGHECLLAWAKSIGAEKVSCPLCRSKILTDDETVTDLKHGLTKGVYRADLRFNEWENFERSCADLDSRLADNVKDDGGKFKIYLYYTTFTLLVDGCLLEPESSTPYDLQPARYPEFELVMDAFTAEAMRPRRWRRGSYADLFAELMDVAYTPLAAALLASKTNMALLSPQSRAELASDPLEAAHYMPDGLNEFIERLLSRLLMFQKLRHCLCTPGCHEHGERSYYNHLCMNGQQGCCWAHGESIDVPRVEGGVMSNETWNSLQRQQHSAQSDGDPSTTTAGSNTPE